MGTLPHPHYEGAQPEDQLWSETSHLFNYGFDPYLSEIFALSNLGCHLGGYVADAKFRMSIIAHNHRSVQRTFRQVVDIFCPLRSGMLLPNVPTVHHILLDIPFMGHKSGYTDDTDKHSITLSSLRSRRSLSLADRTHMLPYMTHPIWKATWKVVEGGLILHFGCQTLLS